RRVGAQEEPGRAEAAPGLALRRVLEGVLLIEVDELHEELPIGQAPREELADGRPSGLGETQPQGLAARGETSVLASFPLFAAPRLLASGGGLGEGSRHHGGDLPGTRGRRSVGREEGSRREKKQGHGCFRSTVARPGPRVAGEATCTTAGRSPW